MRLVDMKRWLIMVVILGLSTLLFLQIQANFNQQSIKQVEAAIQRSLSLCYAQEGFYPAKLDYLIEHYGVQVDTKVYFVYYKTIGANIRPDVSVFRKEP
jgi:Na+-transporting NADH:ubiquinone oxidoreductase subunit NqrB